MNLGSTAGHAAFDAVQVSSFAHNREYIIH
jgi:hypothetical protein